MNVQRRGAAGREEDGGSGSQGEYVGYMGYGRFNRLLVVLCGRISGVKEAQGGGEREGRDGGATFDEELTIVHRVGGEVLLGLRLC